MVTFVTLYYFTTARVYLVLVKWYWTGKNRKTWMLSPVRTPVWTTD